MIYLISNKMSLTDINYFIINPNHLYNYLKNDFETNCKLIQNIIDKNLDDKLINKLLNLLRIYMMKYENYELNAKITTNKHSYFFNIAKEEAKKSLLNHKHGCVIVYKNKIVSTGYNKCSLNNNKTHISLHAEMDALNKFIKNKKFQNKNIRKNCSLYVIRIQNGSDNLKMSKPCKNCFDNIIKNKIGMTYYSTNEEFIDDLICKFIKESV